MRFPALGLAAGLPLLFLGVNAAPTNSDSKVQWIDCNTNIPPIVALQNGLNSTKVADQPSKIASTLKSVTKSLRCGRLDVPMDYSKPLADNNKITLAFTVSYGPA
jgi:cell division inhibitor SulA